MSGSQFAKVCYWDKSYRIVRVDQVPMIEQKIVEKKPFRMHHSMGVDLVQPGAIALITQPSYTEIPQVIKPLAIEAGEDNRVPLPSEITGLIRKAMASRSKVEREWWLGQFKQSCKIWKESGKIEVPNKYNEGERNG